MEPESTQTGTQFLLTKNLNGLLNAVLDEIAEFKQTNQMKSKSLSALGFIIRFCGMKIPPDYFSKQGGIFQHIYHYIDSEEILNAKCEECAQIIGASTDQNIIIPLIIKSINDIESNSSLHPLYVRIKFLANYMTQVQNITAENANLIINSLKSLDLFSLSDASYTQKILLFLFKIYESLVYSLKELCVKFHSDLFFPLLVLSSLPETISLRTNVFNSISQLAKFCNFERIEDLYSLEIGEVLEKFKSTHKTWRRNSPDRFAFDIYVKLAGFALEKHWTEVLLIISESCESEKDIEMRMDMILLIDAIIQNNTLKEQLSNYIDFILPEILFPSTAWKTGRPNYKVRKGSMLGLIHVFQNELIQAETALNYFKDFQMILKSTLEDDWDAELRYIALQVLKQLLLNTSNDITYDQMAEIYSMIIKRLDDSQDANRILTCEILIIFLKIAKRLKISDSIYEYMISNSFIHLDDPKEPVRNAVASYLKEAASIHPKTFINIVEKNENSFTHKMILLEIKNLAVEYLN